MAQRFGRRRALADLLPAVLVTGTAGLVVSLIVGGTTGGLHSALEGDGGITFPSYGADVAAGIAGAGAGDGSGVTVRVRPSLPGPIGVVAALDLVPGPAVASLASTTGRDAAGVRPVVGGEVAATGTAADAGAVQGAGVAGEVVGAASAPAVEAAPALPAVERETVAAASSDRKPRKAYPSKRDRRVVDDGLVALGAGSPVAARAEAADDRTPDARAKSTHESPPAHAPAYGYRRSAGATDVR